MGPSLSEIFEKVDCIEVCLLMVDVLPENCTNVNERI